MTVLEVPIFRRVLRFSDLETILLSWRPASLTLLTLADEELRLRLEAIFAWFANDTATMRDAMRANAAFVGGSLALSLFTPVQFTPRNTDIYVPASRYNRLVRHLTTAEHYDVVSVHSVNPPADIPADVREDETVTSYGPALWHISTLRRGSTALHVLTFGDLPAGFPSSDVVTLSWTTLLFNVVTADHAVCGYPAMTLLGRGLFHMERFTRGLPGSNSLHPLNFYADRGFEFARHPIWWAPDDTQGCDGGWSCPFEQRRFGDGGCLSIPAVGGLTAATGRHWVFGGVPRSVHEE